jgi:hypothetical protein
MRQRQSTAFFPPVLGVWFIANGKMEDRFTGGSSKGPAARSIIDWARRKKTPAGSVFTPILH